MRKQLIYILFALAATLAMTACHSGRQAAGAANRPAGSGAAWHDIYMPVKVSVESPVSQSLSGRATIVCDSTVHISMRLLGFEVAVIHVNADSVFVVDKYHKYLFAESLHNMLGSNPMSLGAMQNIMLGIGTGESLTFGNPASGRDVVITYSERADTPAGSMASSVDISAPMRKDDIQAALDWGVNSAQFNTGRTVSFKAPTGYKPVTLDDVLRVLNQM